MGGGRRSSHNLFEEIISLENLFSAWREFKRGKRKRFDVQQFEFNLEDNIFQLHQELKTKTYRHFDYTPFYITDPKLRHIHKAAVRDRVLHQAIFRIIYPVFDRSFIFDSFSCRLGKGTHRGVLRLEKFLRKLSKNNSRVVFGMKCDIKKFFDSVDQKILLEIIKKKIEDKDSIWLIEKIIKSFEKEKGRALPLGNVTSQLFANIYLNELDQFVKRKLKVEYYLRYCDDFIILSDKKEYLLEIVEEIKKILAEKLKLSLHEDKVVIRKHRWGVDFLGYVVLPYHRVLRTRTKRRIFSKIKVRKQQLEKGQISVDSFKQSIESYLGVLSHCNGYEVEKELLKLTDL